MAAPESCLRRTEGGEVNARPAYLEVTVAGRNLRLAHVVTYVASVRSLAAGVTLHAGSHGCRLFLAEHLAPGNPTVAYVATDVCFFVMHRMREPYVVWNPIEAHPGDRLFRARIGRQLLNRSAIRFHARVASHADLLCRYTGSKTGLPHGMTVETLYSGSRVCLMAE